MKQKQFNLSEFVSNEETPVVTRSGLVARIVVTDLKRKETPLLALVTEDNGLESVIYVDADGIDKSHDNHSGYDLFFKAKNITDRIKNFDDAYQELGSNHPLCLEYEKARLAGIAKDGSDLAAYLKLRIVVAALNEGWEPQFTEDEYRYFPWFYFYTKKEWEELSEEDKCRVVGRSLSYANASGGLVFACSGHASSYAYSYGGSRLAFRTRELAEYAGKQFIELYADYCVGGGKQDELEIPEGSK
jgi:hypothetical protein|nr:MAG TPA: hypothetical protein [Caudoviricetes sp.]